MNKTMLAGRVAEVNAGTGSKPYARLKVITRKYVPQKGYQNEYHTLVAFGNLAEPIAKLRAETFITAECEAVAGRPYLKKTAPVSDKERERIQELIKEGHLVGSVDLIVRDWEKLESPRQESDTEDNGDEEQQDDPAPAPPRRRPAPANDEVDPFENNP